MRGSYNHAADNGQANSLLPGSGEDLSTVLTYEVVE